jgi:BirA family biotin operon repressor/biotin-[acetyl-CoA-carboxylase] ligase
LSKRSQISFVSEVVNLSSPDFIFNDFYYFNKISSTQDFAFEIIKRRRKINPSVVICNTQSHGKGRKGYLWSSPEGGIWVSIFLESALKLENLFLFVMIAAICICETIEKETNLKPKVKWPNDVFVNGKKVAGILLDVETCIDNGKNKIIIGLGINTNNDLRLTKSKLKKNKDHNHYPMTTLRDEANKPDVSNARFLSRLLNNLSHNLSNIESDTFVNENILNNYIKRIMESRSHIVYSFNVDEKAFEGEIVDVDIDGSLLVKDIVQQKIIKIHSANSVNLR